MKLILQKTLCCFFFLLAVTPSSAQDAKVTIKLDGVNMDKVLGEIERQTNYLFIYNNRLDLRKPVSVDAENQSIIKVLRQLFDGMNVDYTLEGNHIMLTRRDQPVSGSASVPEGTVSGVVLDERNTPILGASVMLKGTSAGVITDPEGHFRLKATQGQTLVVSFMGYATQEVPVTTQTLYRVTLGETAQQMEGVVVTALGIKRSEKALSYNTQQVSANDINMVRDVNVMNALNGKVAGAVVNASASGIGGASRVILRGLKVINNGSSNNALYVVDGIPLFNVNKGSIDGEYQAQPRGEGITDINPEDIESITVLTGPGASALYGSNAANGVVMITTKKGKAGKPQISFSQQTTFANPLMMPQFQNTYGNMPKTYSSWGAKLATPSTYDPADFFNTSVNAQTTASVSVGNDKNQTYVSLMHAAATGIIPNNEYNKYSITFRNTTTFLDERMTLDAGFSYIETDDQNMISSGRYYNPLTSLYTYPRGETIEDLMLFEIYDPNVKYNVQNWAWGLQGLDMQNPLWQMYRNLQQNKRRRGMLHLNLTYDVNDWLTLAGRAKADMSVGEASRKLNATTHSLFAGGNKGYFSYTKEEYTSRYADFIATVNKRWCDVSLFANAGASIEDYITSSAGARGPLELANFFSLANTNPYGASGRRIQERTRQQNQAVFGSVEVGWKNRLFLTATGRNEWDSALANTSTQHYFFPSVGLSGIVSEMAELPRFVSYLKFMGSWSEVGSPIPRGISILTYEWKQGAWSTSAIRPIQTLKPERTSSWEVGMNARFLKNTLSLDFTYYNSATVNQTYNVPLSGSSAYQAMWLQTGKVGNRGFEMQLGYNGKWGGFGWNPTVTLSHNNNEILELAYNHYDEGTDGYYSLDEYQVASMGGVLSILTKGGTMGDVYAYGDLAIDQNGYLYVDPATNNISIDNKRVKLGSTLPDYNAGFRNEFSYKGVNLSVMLSGRFGGIVVSPTQGFLDGLGVSRASAEARDAGGIPVNNGWVDAQQYYETIGTGQVLTQYTYSATNVRLQELSVGYTFPRKLFRDKCSLTASLVGHNLMMIYCKAPFDPELTPSTGSYLQGIDYFMQPSLRSYGFNVQLKF